MHFFLLNILLILFSCNDGKLHKAEYNHPIEDPVKAYLVGVYKKEIIPEKNEIIIHNSTETIEENSSLDVGISFKNTNDISDEQVIYISSNNPIIRVEPNILVFNRNSATNNQIIKVKTELLPTIAPEKIELSLKSSGIDEKIVIFSVVDSIGQKILIEGDGESNEEEEDSIRVKLRKKPISENYIISITPNDSFVSLVNTKVEFTQTDYNEFKTVKYTVNDNYNDYHSYKITLNNENITADYLFNVKDNDHQYRSCSGENSNDGFTPALTIVNNEVITVSKKYQPETNTDYYLNFYKCDLNGDSCSNTRYRDISFIDLNLFSAIPFQPKISHESSYDYFQIPISLSTGELNLFNCNNTLTDCRLAYSVSSGIFPKYITADKKLYIMSGNEPIVLLHIDNQNNIIDGNNYGEIVSEVYHNYGSRGFVYDSKNDTFLSVYTGDTVTSYYLPLVLKIPGNLSANPEMATVSTEYQSGLTPDMVIDTINNKVLITAIHYGKGGKLYLYRCDLDITNCEAKDVSGGKLATAFFPKINLDLEHKKILIVSYDDDAKLYLSHCDLDGSNCKVSDISLGHRLVKASTEYHFDSIIDTLNNRLIVVFTEKDTGKLGLVRFGLGGF